MLAAFFLLACFGRTESLGPGGSLDHREEHILGEPSSLGSVGGEDVKTSKILPLHTTPNSLLPRTAKKANFPRNSDPHWT